MRAPSLKNCKDGLLGGRRLWVWSARAKGRLMLVHWQAFP